MVESNPDIVDLKALVADNLNGKKGFANTKKLKKLGMQAYCQWLEGELAKKVTQRASKAG